MNLETQSQDSSKQVRLGPKTVSVPEDWQKVRIEDVSEIVTRGKQPTYVEEGGVPVLNQSCIYWDGFHEEETRRLDEDVAEGWKEKYFVQEGDILINSTGKGTLGRALYWTESSGEVALDSHITRISVNQEAVSPQYLRYYLESKWGQTMLYVYCVSGSTGQIELSKTDLLSMPILVPPLPEQHRIADVLSTVDKCVEQMSESGQKSDELGKGLRQDILLGKDAVTTQQVQIGPKTEEIPENWATAKLGDIGRDGKHTFIDGDWVESSDMVDEGEYQLIQLGNIGVGEFKGECDKFVSQSFFEEKNCTLVEQGDLLISRLADPVMRTTEVPEFDKKSITAVDIVIAKVDESQWDKRYLLHLLNSKTMFDVGDSLATGSTRLRISRSNMAGITIPKPPLSTQSEIASVLDTAQRKAEQEKQAQEKLQELKRGLMQDFLTGKRRLKLDA